MDERRNLNIGEDEEKLEPFCTAGENIKGANIMEKVWCFL